MLLDIATGHQDTYSALQNFMSGLLANEINMMVDASVADFFKDEGESEFLRLFITTGF